jgi:hypothetical protein
VFVNLLNIEKYIVKQKSSRIIAAIDSVKVSWGTGS